MNWLTRFLVCGLAVLAFVSVAVAGAKRPPKVLILHATPSGFPTWPDDVQNKIASSSLFTTVDRMDVRVATPSLATLLSYDAVLVFSDAGFLDPTALGNVLADYVDAGGGVVSSTFTNASVPLAGRWAPGYLVINPAGQTAPNASLGTIANQNHPIMIGVTALAATQAYQGTGAVLAGNTLVASWSTGGPLVATSNTLPGRADLNFYPVSSDSRADFWNTAGDGAKLMVNALLYVMRPRVLIAGVESTSTNWVGDVKSKVRATGLIGITDTLNLAVSTPTLAQLQSYDATLVWTDAFSFNSSALGNVLADYVDSGGGVVTSMFASAGLAIGGRWSTGYQLIAPSSQTSGASSLGAITYGSHPAMLGVAAFNGGTSSYRPSTGALNPGAFAIAKWADSRPLVVASTKLHNRLDLGFFPPSSTVRADLWTAATDGGKLMANALVYTAKPYILVGAADNAPFQADTVAKLNATKRFSGVGTVDLGMSSPTIDVYTPYNAVLTWSDAPYFSPATIGNTLADYVDAGGGVVVGVFANTNAGGNLALQGRWPTGGYDICPTASAPNYTNTGPAASLGLLVEPFHPITRFVRRFDGGSASYRGITSPLLRGRTIMKWSDGNMLAAVHNFRKRADLGYFTPSSGTTLGTLAWNQRTDGTWMTANAIEFVVRAKPCPGDFNGDGQVDDFDFVLFASYYDALVDPRGDLNGDGLTEDSDFVIFASGYNELVCP